MPYLLDTNAWVAFMKGHSALTSHIRRAGKAELRLCAPVQAELWFGVFTIITHNTREFARVPGLAVEDWQA